MKKKKILIVSAKYYSEVSRTMEKETIYHLENNKDLNIKHKFCEVPGIFEIPVIIARNIKNYDGFIALGCVIRGETPHFDFISKATTDAIMKLSIDYKKPIGNGIITCLNKKQADARSNKKGREAAKAVISILSH